LRSMRLSGSVAVILVVSPGCGCAYDGDPHWPGTDAILVDRDFPRALARVPIDQRASVHRRSMAITNNTPVIIVDDPAYPALARGPASSDSSRDPVRVRVTMGVN
jgi:hypothetical protein